MKAKEIELRVTRKTVKMIKKKNARLEQRNKHLGWQMNKAATKKLQASRAEARLKILLRPLRKRTSSRWLG